MADHYPVAHALSGGDCYDSYLFHNEHDGYEYIPESVGWITYRWWDFAIRPVSD